MANCGFEWNTANWKGKCRWKAWLLGNSFNFAFFNCRKKKAILFRISYIHYFSLQVSILMAEGQKNKSFFYPFCGVTEELKTFLSDISQATLKVYIYIYICFSTLIIHVWSSQYRLHNTGHDCFLWFFWQNDDQHELEERLSFLEGARDVAVLDAMLESGNKQGTPIQIKRFWIEMIAVIHRTWRRYI